MLKRNSVEQDERWQCEDVQDDDWLEQAWLHQLVQASSQPGRDREYQQGYQFAQLYYNYVYTPC